jgi:hypothetical protein
VSFARTTLLMLVITSTADSQYSAGMRRGKGLLYQISTQTANHFSCAQRRSLYYKALLISVGSGVTFKYGTFCQYRNTRFRNRVLVA